MIQLFLALCALVWAAPSDQFLSDPEALVALEKQGYSFARQMGAPGEMSNLKLYEANAGYKLIADTLDSDLKAMLSNNTGPSMRFSRRLFHSGWLRSKKASYELAGVVIRHDRAFRHQQMCGEIRLIYRLAYKDDAIKTFSRLPMTIQHVRLMKPPCKPGGPVAERLAASELHDVELNLQSVRWPAAIRPDMGGYAEYIMRAFEKMAEGWRAKPLENTLDVAKLKRDPALKKELLAWLRDPANLTLFDRGEGVLERKFLTTKGVSVAVHGLNRAANRLFDQVFSEEDFHGLDYSQTLFVKSPKGYLRKLDESTCIGCHQSRSIAGFHFLGHDRANALQFNRVNIPFSNHFWTDQKRREAIVPGSRRANLGFADRPVHVTGARNERCYVGGDKSFTGWTCASGLKCEPVGSAEGAEFFGVCQEKNEGLAGDACHIGRVTQDVNSHKDKEVGHAAKPCAGHLGCLNPSDSYPGGLCFANGCDPEGSATCGALAVPGFNPCLAQGRPFKECLAKFTGSIEAGGCSLEKPCRDDFICMEGFKGKGVCAPPYSLFQLRVDGHVRP